MKEINYWERFMNSGRVSDYLCFREENMLQAEKGENPHAGIDKCNGNDSKDDAYR